METYQALPSSIKVHTLRWIRGFGKERILFCFLLCSSVMLWQPPNARASAVRAALGIGGAGTEWRTDGVLNTQLKLGFRFVDFFAVYGEFNLGYANVDQRVLTLFSLGVQFWWKLGITRPFARLSVLHQHEESLSVIAGDFFRAVLGLGEGIRHRGGVGLGLGADIPVFKRKKLELFVTVEAFLKWFPGDMGPAIYGGGNIAFGINYTV